MYAIMKVEGNVAMMEHLYVDRIDYCCIRQFKPFRVRIMNQFMITTIILCKVADASRVYGLEFEDILFSPPHQFFTGCFTLVEEQLLYSRRPVYSTQAGG